MVRAVLLVALAACGRIDFDHTSDGSLAGDDAVGDGAALDTFVAVCGDGTCSGNAGELCVQCSADCNTTAVVCGNGECQPGEDGTMCYADCGPSPWPWTQDETDLLTAINAARTGGTMCPGDVTPRIAAALTLNTTILPGAREYTWEIAHEQFNMGNGASCNGRTFAQRQATYGANGGLSMWSTTGPFATMTDVVNVWKADATLCPFLMKTGTTMAATAVAHDAWDGYAVWMK